MKKYIDFINENINSLKEITLKEAISLSQLSDIQDVSEWLHKNNNDIKFFYKEEPISKFENTIKEMESTYDEFPDEYKRTRKIYKLLKNGEKPKAIFIKLKDKDNFIMEGRHRIVAFKWLDLDKVPVIYVD